MLLLLWQTDAKIRTEMSNETVSVLLVDGIAGHFKHWTFRSLHQQKFTHFTFGSEMGRCSFHSIRAYQFFSIEAMYWLCVVACSCWTDRHCMTNCYIFSLHLAHYLWKDVQRCFWFCCLKLFSNGNYTKKKEWTSSALTIIF